MDVESSTKDPSTKFSLFDTLRSTFFLNSEGSKKRLDIQALRAFAILLVYCFHFFPETFPNGYLGVDVFFVLSGYLMALVLSKEKTIGIRNSLEFYYRRAKRIIPCFYAVILLTTISMILVMNVPWLEDNSKKGIDALLFRTNLENIRERSDYFQANGLGSNRRLFMHSWSLCVEMQFYVIVPLIFFLLKNIYRQKTIFCVVSLMIGVIVSWCFNQSLSSNSVKQFNDPLSRVWQFLLGIIAFTLSFPRNSGQVNLNTKFRVFTASVLHIIFVGCIFTGFLTIKWDDLVARTVATSLTSVGLVLGSHSQTVMISNPLLTYIGDASYSLYLTHWPVLKMSQYYGYWHDIDDVYVLNGAFILSVLSALILHHFFEKTHLEWGKMANILLSIGLFSASFAIAFYSLTIGKELIGENKQVVIDNLELVHPRYAHDEATYKKFLGFGGMIPFGLATFPPGNGSLSVLVTGNSYAPQIMFTVKKILAGRYKSLHLYAILGNQVINGENSEKLADSNRRLVQYLRPDVVIVASRLTKQQKALDKGPYDERVVEGMRRMNAMGKYCKHILVVGAQPYYPREFINTFMERVQRNMTLDDMNLDREQADREMASGNSIIRKLVRRSRKGTLIDTAKPLLDKTKTQYQLFDPVSKLAYCENTVHYTHKGLERIEPAFRYLERLILEAEKNSSQKEIIKLKETNVSKLNQTEHV